jgi:hypothetical protein
MSSKNNVNPDHYKVAGRERPGQALGQENEKSRYAKARKSARRRAPGGDFIPGKHNAQISAKSSGKVKSRATRPSPAAAAQRAKKGEAATTQVSASKQGVRSSSRKRVTTRHGTNPIPATNPVPGAFGATGTLSETEEEMVDTEPRPGRPDDFLEKRRRENKRARK